MIPAIASVAKAHKPPLMSVRTCGGTCLSDANGGWSSRRVRDAMLARRRWWFGEEGREEGRAAKSRADVACFFMKPTLTEKVRLSQHCRRMKSACKLRYSAVFRPLNLQLSGDCELLRHNAGGMPAALVCLLAAPASALLATRPVPSTTLAQRARPTVMQEAPTAAEFEQLRFENLKLKKEVKRRS